MTKATIWVLGLFAAMMAACPAVASASNNSVRLDADAFDRKIFSSHGTVDSSGREQTTFHQEILIRNDAGVAEFGQYPLDFDDETEKLDLLEAYTRKPDGRKIPVNLNAVYLQLAQGDDATPQFDSTKQKIVVFPQLAAGDTMVLTYRRTELKPTIPGQFSRTFVLAPDFAIDDFEMSLAVSDRFKVNVFERNLTVKRIHQGHIQLFRLSYHHPVAPADYISELDDRDVSPMVLISSYATWDQFAAKYADLIAPTLTQDRAIAAQANQITQGVTDRAARTKLIYDWVSTHIRYVAVELGNGGYVPHSAATVLALGYGDCKDHATLFSALLKAEGIPSVRVLINSNASYQLGDVPTMGAFDHMITWLPELKIYADTTAQFAPFGALPFREYGKPVIFVVNTGDARHTVPILTPGTARTVTTISSAIDSENRIIGDISYSGTGPFDFAARGDGFYAQSQGADYDDEVLQERNLSGTARVTSSTEPTDLDQKFTLQGHFVEDPNPGILADNETSMPAGLNLGYVPGEFLLGPLNPGKLPATAPTPCYSGTEERDLSLRLPPGYRIEKAPSDLILRTAHGSYSSVWHTDNAAGRIERTMIFTSRVDQAVCTGALRREATDLIAKIKDDLDQNVTLITTAAWQEQQRDLETAQTLAAFRQSPWRYIATSFSQQEQSVGALALYNTAIATEALLLQHEIPSWLRALTASLMIAIPLVTFQIFVSALIFLFRTRRRGPLSSVEYAAGDSEQ